MTETSADMDWNPGVYQRFRGFRLRPALDLLRSLGPLPEGDIVDLGCGSGEVGPALGQLRRRLVGVDSSPAMLHHAKLSGSYSELHEIDAAEWSTETPVAMIFSNAALQWVPDHQALLPKLAAMLAPGGYLAIQIPHQRNAPSHRLWRQLVDELFPGRVDHGLRPKILLPAEYHRLLSPLGQVSLWETEYYQELAPDGEGHPVRRFTEGTYARPILQRLEMDEQAKLITAYESVIGKAYPKGPNGSVLFPLRRMFITLKV